MNKRADVIVIGIGGVGSAAAYFLAKRGARVIGIDRFQPGHPHGSSHGMARVVQRTCYHQSQYLPLLDRAMIIWHELEELLAEKLFAKSGLLIVGPEGGPLITATQLASNGSTDGLNRVDRKAFGTLFPDYYLAPDHKAFLEMEAGHINPRNCVRGFVRAANSLGAEFVIGGAVLNWKINGGVVEVGTSEQTFEADRLVITPGPWAVTLLGDIAVTFQVRRYHRHWFPPQSESCFSAIKGVPAFFYETAAGVYYGTPAEDRRGVMVVEYGEGEPVADPSNVSWEIDHLEQQRVESFIKTFLPGLTLPARQHVVCVSTMSPDRHFIVDQHPKSNSVVFAAGLSGHGFKFASALGEALSELALDGKTKLDLEFLRRRRFLDPEAVPLEPW